MADFFWDQFIEIEEIKLKIETYNFNKKKKSELLEIVYQTFDLKILDRILTILPPKKQRKFLDRFSRSPHRKEIIDNLKEDIQDLEEKIKEICLKVKKEVLEFLQTSSEG